MNIADIREAMRLPAKADVDRRVPKNAFVEQIKGTADRKLFEITVERLDWLASLSPTSIGVAAATIDEAAVDEVQIFALTTRKEPTQRLLQVIHSALPYPLVMLTHWPDGAAVRFSLFPRFLTSGGLLLADIGASPAPVPFIASLDLATLPRTDLAALYLGLVERVQALWAAQISGGAFRLAANAVEVEARDQALAAYRVAEAEYRALKSAAAREKRLARAVELGDKTARAKALMDMARQALL